MTWAHWLVLLLFLIGLGVAESLRNQERAAANKEETNEQRNTYRSGYIPSRHKSPAHPSVRQKLSAESSHREAAPTNTSTYHRRHTTSEN